MYGSYDVTWLDVPVPEFQRYVDSRIDLWEEVRDNIHGLDALHDHETLVRAPLPVCEVAIDRLAHVA